MKTRKKKNGLESSSSTAASSKPDAADAGTDAAAPQANRKQPREKKPPSLKATVAVLLVVFLIMSPSVRWRVSEFNLWVRSTPLGTPIGERPGGPAADMVIVDSRFGANSELMTGRYVLRKDMVNSRYSWYKNSPGQEAYLLWDDCGAWLISRFSDGNSPNCEGWSYTNRCFGMPWECSKMWMLREDGRWENAGSTVKVTAHYGEIPKAYDPDCSSDEEEDLIEKFSKIDIVVPWVNGSDPHWLANRESACEEWQWQEMWSDAVSRSAVSKSCLKEKESVAEATDLMKRRGCEQGIFGREGACAWGNLKEAPHGLTTRTSRCFIQFVNSHCTGRLHSIKDHDELRYLLRSLERNLPWHKGRIVLITPNRTAPKWLKLGNSRLEVVAQEEILKRAMESNEFVNAAERGRVSEWAPDRIFNDYPVEAVLAFTPKASRVLMLVQDDLLLARPVSICNFFTTDPIGLRLFARPFDGIANRDPFSGVYESSEHWTSRLFAELSKKKDGKASPYYRILHLPHLLDTNLLKDIWRDYSKVMSDAASSSSFRHPNVTNTIALHHSEAARRHAAASVEREDGVEKTRSDLDSSIQNLVMNMSGTGPIDELPWMEVVFESLQDWHDKMTVLPPDPAKLPLIVGMQDNIGGDTSQDDIDELDCLREKWLNELLPTPSSWEDAEVKPTMCRLLKQKKKLFKSERCSLKNVVVAGGEAIQEHSMGKFSRTSIASGSEAAGRAIYKNSDSKYLFYRAHTGCWLIGDDYKVIHQGIRLQSQKKESAKCPTEAIGWEIYDNGWKARKEISITQPSASSQQKDESDEL